MPQEPVPEDLSSIPLPPENPPEDDFDPDQAQQRLDRLGDDIDRTRREVSEDLDPAATEERERYGDSGATPDEDDQNAAPA